MWGSYGHARTGGISMTKWVLEGLQGGSIDRVMGGTGQGVRRGLGGVSHWPRLDVPVLGSSLFITMRDTNTK